MSPGPELGALFVLTAVVAGLVAVAWAYLVRIELPRPPIGVYGGSDIVIMSALVVAAPLAYLALPKSAVAAVFGVVVFAAVQLALAPLLGGRLSALAAALLCSAVAAAWLLHHAGATEVLNDAALAVAVVGVANLWVQSGMRASQITAFAVLLTGYDLTATSLTTVMSRFADEVSGIAFAPQFVIATGRAPLGIGLGDLLMLVLFPLAAVKAFGRAAGLVAAVAAVAVTAVAAVLLGLGALGAQVPLLTLLGPVICVQYLLWRRAGYRERTVAQWRAGTPARRAAASAADADTDALSAALRAAWSLPIPAEYGEGEGEDDGAWVAIDEGRVVGSGASMGLARKSARLNGHAGVPIVRGTRES